MENSFNDFLIMLSTFNFEGEFAVLRIVFIGLSIFLFVSIVIFSFRSDWLKFLIFEDSAEFLSFKPYGARRIVNVWNKIMKRLETGIESEYKLAILEADTILDNTLKRMGFVGETLGERLGNLTSATLSNIEEIERVHKVRNEILHDPDYKISLDETKEILAVYEKALRDLDEF